MRDFAAYISVILTAGLALGACMMIVHRMANGRRPGKTNAVEPSASGAQVAIFLTAAIAISIAPIFGYWYSGNSTDVALGGFLPWNDALIFFMTILRVDSFCSWNAVNL